MFADTWKAKQENPERKGGGILSLADRHIAETFKRELAKLVTPLDMRVFGSHRRQSNYDPRLQRRTAGVNQEQMQALLRYRLEQAEQSLEEATVLSNSQLWRGAVKRIAFLG